MTCRPPVLPGGFTTGAGLAIGGGIGLVFAALLGLALPPGLVAGVLVGVLVGLAVETLMIRRGPPPR